MTPAFALRRRPDAAFEALYRRHAEEVYRYALAVLGNPSDAEDVTQTTFMNAYRAFQAGERPRKPKSWLRAIAHNVCRQRFRQAARRPHELSAFDEIADDHFEDEPEGPTADDIARGLRSLPFNQRSALVMRELEGRSQTEIAAELDLSVSAVEALLFRARRALREQLETSFTCGEAARAISRGLDQKLSREDRAALRAHLRECSDCATFARQARAQRGAFKALGAVPLPAALASWQGLTSGAVGASAAAAAGPSVGIVVKVAASLLAAGAIAGAGDIGIHKLTEKPAPPAQRAEGKRQSPATPAAERPARPAAAAAIGSAHPRTDVPVRARAHGRKSTPRPVASPASTRPDNNPSASHTSRHHPSVAKQHSTPTNSTRPSKAHRTPPVKQQTTKTHQPLNTTRDHIKPPRENRGRSGH